MLKTRTQFPNDDSVAKTLWLAIVDTGEKRAGQRARQAGKPKAKRDSATLRESPRCPRRFRKAVP
ncbi:MAG TPA: hypothetical protein VMV92_21685 [Streptosporangiaceae bacterium]|nr:hypothetical protein [Streptosporangiaceae bacterium]